MSRRILGAIMVVTVLTIAGFAFPLAAAVQQLYRNEGMVRLGREAARTAMQVPETFRTAQDPVELPTPDQHTMVGLYSPDGHRLQGSGPLGGGPEVASAAAGRVAESAHGALVVATPLSSNEQVFAVVRAELPAAVVAGRVHHAWLLMAALGAVVIDIAAFAARLLSLRIARPVADLASTTARLGDGDFTARAARSGISELDVAAESLDLTARRLGQLMDRERAFSADVSHQLRTPLTGLRLHLESALANPSLDANAAMTVALGEVDHLEATIDDLLTLARDTDQRRSPADISAVIDGVALAWHGRLARRGRPLRIDVSAAVPNVAASPRAIRQILEVLLSNAEAHGKGVVRVVVYPVSGGVAVDVGDDGRGVDGDPVRIFERRSGRDDSHGIGLPLARSLAEAEGGRLLLADNGPSPVFRLILREVDVAEPSDR